MFHLNIFVILICPLLGIVIGLGSYRNAYDYIIVGGGGAGCVLARRLSENPNVTVLLIEAGPDDEDDPFIPIPRTFLSVVQNKKYEWGFKTEPQPNLTGNRTLEVPFAKVLGGSTSHNGMNVVRGSRHDFDRWAALGNKGWSYQDVLPYFKKSEDMHDEELKNSEYHGTGGVWATKMTVDTPFIRTFVKAGEELGYKEVDYNGETQYGFGRLQNSINPRGERMSTSRAFLRPVIMRRNLDVIVEAHATKIDTKTVSGSLKAVGVFFLKDGKKQYISAKQEVIVSCGAINSPKLLMLSGIGPKKHLQEHNIQVVADLPVGNDLEDHIAIHFAFWFKNDQPLHVTKSHSFQSLFEYLFAGSGPWSSYASQGTSFHRSNRQPENEKMPYIEIPMAIYVWGLDEDFAADVRDGKDFDKEFAKRIEKYENLRIGISSASILYHPRTRGTVRLKSTDPLEIPKISKNYFENPDDIEDLLQGVRIAQKIAGTKVMRDAGVEPLRKFSSGCTKHKKDSDDFWRCAIVNEAMSFAHFAGSCKMAPDKTGVVDDRLRVKGVTGLRVVDTSIMPYIISGHAMTSTIMIAEKASDMIKEDFIRRK